MPLLNHVGHGHLQYLQDPTGDYVDVGILGLEASPYEAEMLTWAVKMSPSVRRAVRRLAFPCRITPDLGKSTEAKMRPEPLSHQT